jgi:hypothetical protein
MAQSFLSKVENQLAGYVNKLLYSIARRVLVSADAVP